MSIIFEDVFDDDYDCEIPLYPCLSIQAGDYWHNSYSIGRQEHELLEELNDIKDDYESYGFKIGDELIVWHEHDECNKDELFKWIIGKGKVSGVGIYKQENEEVKNEESDEESDEELVESYKEVLRPIKEIELNDKQKEQYLILKEKIPDWTLFGLRIDEDDNLVIINSVGGSIRC